MLTDSLTRVLCLCACDASYWKQNCLQVYVSEISLKCTAECLIKETEISQTQKTMSEDKTRPPSFQSKIVLCQETAAGKVTFLPLDSPVLYLKSLTFYSEHGELSRLSVHKHESISVFSTSCGHWTVCFLIVLETSPLDSGRRGTSVVGQTASIPWMIYLHHLSFLGMKETLGGEGIPK